MASNSIRVAYTIALGVASTALAGDPARLFGTNARNEQRLADASQLERAERWTEAVDHYLRIADEAGDELVAASDNKRHLVPVRSLIQQRLGVRREMIDRYRQRMEARIQLALASADPRDVKALVQIVTTNLCSRAAETALHRLGDLSCEAGDFVSARRWWAMLLPPVRRGQIAHPDPVGDVALVRAKLILARLLAGELSEARRELDTYRQNHMAATGHLAGRDGNFLATLEQLLAAPSTVVATTNSHPAEPTTFGLDATRNAVLTGRLPAYAPETRYPPLLLSDASPRMEDRLTQQTLLRQSALAFHPLVVNRKVFVADAVGITAFDLDSGARVARFTLDRTTHRLPALDTKLPSSTEVRYTLSSLGDRLFARFGQPRVRVDRADADSYLTCVRVGSDGSLKLVWSLPALKPEDVSAAVWEGTPLERDGRLFAAITRIEGNRAVTAVACLDPSEPRPAILWQQDVFEASGETAERTQHLLLTHVGSLVICGPHAGVIVALDAATGKRAWAMRYEVSDAKPEVADAPFRALGPCIAAGGILYAAPADAERVFAFDATTGEPVWQSDPISLTHLLGVARGVVVGQRSAPIAGLAGLDADTGRVLPAWGYALFAGDGLAPFGRGLMAADRVYWPTRAGGIREIRLDGTVEYSPTSFQSLPGGNLAYGEGGLIVATEDRLYVLLPPTMDASAPAVQLDREIAGLVAVQADDPARVAHEPRAAVFDEASVQKRRSGVGSSTLEPGREWAVFFDGFDESYFVASGSGITRYDWPDSRAVWIRSLSFTPVWVGGTSGVVVAGGSSQIAGIDASTGRLLWQESFARSTRSEIRGWRDRFPLEHNQPTLPEFRLNEANVSVRRGQHRPIALDLRTGQATSTPSGEDFSFHCGDLAISVGDRRITATNPSTGQMAWEHELTGRLSVNGNRPFVRSIGSDLLVVVARNDGFGVERLHAKTGRVRPGISLIGLHAPIDPSAVAVVANTLLIASGSKLTAWDEGRIAWQMPLDPVGLWQLEPAGEGLVAAWPIPSATSVPLTKWPVLVVSVSDGRTTRRWEFGRPGAHGSVRVANGTLTIATESEIKRVSILGRRDDP